MHRLLPLLLFLPKSAGGDSSAQRGGSSRSDGGGDACSAAGGRAGADGGLPARGETAVEAWSARVFFLLIHWTKSMKKNFVDVNIITV